MSGQAVDSGQEDGLRALGVRSGPHHRHLHCLTSEGGGKVESVCYAEMVGAEVVRGWPVPDINRFNQ
ncbi:hypothetical protein RRG08_007541 [Elysia crispata]|uniref:Uncharacterized protein n=1 Tax=Elysia crispata TaxID=231223 RepID=A0AAE0YES8_9GAST|nr:hypothetical protein RRG08_007541 [Elysia crispata]